MKVEDFTEWIGDLIAKDDLKTAINELHQFLKKSKRLDEIILQSARYNDVMKEIRLGTIDLEQANITKNKIRYAILDLLEKNRKAADFGAKIIVWNEASFYTFTSDEERVVGSIQNLAKESDASIVASYIVLISENPLKYHNKLVFINNKGEIAYSYLKHQPVPGEPAVKGTEPFQTVEVAESKVGAAICYDYDFPYIAQEYGKLKADIVALPSSDWRGIDPLHTRMAAFRAIEQGHSIIRSTRFGLSAIISPYGEIISQASSFDENCKILISNVQSARIKTIFTLIGDFFIYFCVGFVFVFLIKFLVSPQK